MLSNLGISSIRIENMDILERNMSLQVNCVVRMVMRRCESLLAGIVLRNMVEWRAKKLAWVALRFPIRLLALVTWNTISNCGQLIAAIFAFALLVD